MLLLSDQRQGKDKDGELGNDVVFVGTLYGYQLRTDSLGDDSL